MEPMHTVSQSESGVSPSLSTALFAEWFPLLEKLDEWERDHAKLEVELQLDGLLAPSLRCIAEARKWIDQESKSSFVKCFKGVLMTGDGGLAFWWEWNKRMVEFDPFGNETYLNLANVSGDPRWGKRE